MKRIIVLLIFACCLLFTCCSDKSTGIIGGADVPTNIVVSEEKEDIVDLKDAEKYFKDNYVDIRKLPILDVHVENPFESDDRTLILDDSIENNIEMLMYEYYRNKVSGNFSSVKDAIAGKDLLAATENEEKQFDEGIYFSKIVLDEIEVIDKDELNDIQDKNKQRIAETLRGLDAEEFAIVEIEKTVKLNEKYLSMAPQIGDGDVTRYYLLGKTEGIYKIVDVFWEGFIFL